MAEADLLPASNLRKQGRLEEAEGRLHDLPVYRHPDGAVPAAAGA